MPAKPRGKKKSNRYVFVKHPGRGTRRCKRHGFKSFTCECLKQMYKDGKDKNNRSLIGMALLGKSIRGCTF